jgi:GT2 family glycosyltransferase
VEFGRVNAFPRFSVIIPLYGRLDFVEYQMAFFSSHPSSFDYEFIYVLDDPPKRREAERLFNSVYARFRIPFRALLMEQNAGYAPANNVGLRDARGTYICFLNSDVFPGPPDWLEQLARRLEANPDLGTVGPLLLYGDGSVQHEGMIFKRLPEFGNWLFPDHPRKGMKPAPVSGLRRHIAVTGACMLLRRDLAQELGGFDESYVIGDFEDTDLCLRLHRMGLDCAVDLDVQLYHLERKSQASSAQTWRMNMTLYYAWLHQQRWADTIVSHPLYNSPVVDLLSDVDQSRQ